MWPFRDYEKVPYDDSDVEDRTRRPTPKTKKNWCYRTFTIISVILNIVVILYLVRSANRPDPSSGDGGLYSGLQRTIIQEYDAHSPYSDPNRTVADAYWDNAALIGSYHAVGPEFIRDHGLGQSLSWPWDEDRKIYIMSAHHNLHCLMLIRRTLLHAVHGEPKGLDHREGLEHALHCIEGFRQDVMCEADETFWYFDPQEHHIVRGPKKCRDWKKFQDFSDNFYQACWRNIIQLGFDGPKEEAFKFCPPGYVYPDGTHNPPWDTSKPKWKPKPGVMESLNLDLVDEDRFTVFAQDENYQDLWG